MKRDGVTARRAGKAPVGDAARASAPAEAAGRAVSATGRTTIAASARSAARAAG
jgi:hypothetical protein